MLKKPASMRLFMTFPIITMKIEIFYFSDRAETCGAHDCDVRR